MVLRGKGRQKIDNAVDAYNRSGSRASLSLDFNFTGNGIGLAMKF